MAEAHDKQDRKLQASANESAKSDAKMQLYKDPVCKMQVKASQAAAKFEYDGKTYYFCHSNCKAKFQNNPGLYLQKPEAETNYYAEASSDAKAKANRQVAAARPAEHELKSFFLPEGLLVYSCPMHPQIKQKNPGDCSICGMPLESALGGSTAGSEELAGLKRDLGLSAILSGILMLVSMPMMLGLNLEFLHLHKTEHAYFQLALSLPVVFYCGRSILFKALNSFLHMQLNMFSLIGSGVMVSMLLSLWALFIARPVRYELLYFESAAGIITLVLLGQWLELKVRSGSDRLFEDLFKLTPSLARLEKEDGSFEDLPVDKLQKGDKVRVLAGDLLPVDGQVLEGQSSVDESMLSGNSLPVEKSAGAKVFAGTQNKEGSLLIKAESLGKETVFAQMAKLLLSSKQSRSPVQNLADKVSAVFIPAVLLIALLTFFCWWLLDTESGLKHGLQNAVSVLVIACPCALGLATPLAVSAAIGRAAELGLLIKDSASLELLGRARMLLADKTGTLSKGEFALLDLLVKPGMDEDHVLAMAAALESESRHPLARAVCRLAAERSLRLPDKQEVKTYAGKGLSAVVSNSKLLIGNRKLMTENDIDLSLLNELLNKGAASKNTEEGSSIYLALEGELISLFFFRDRLKDEALQFVDECKELGLELEVLSGDSQSEIEHVAKELKLDKNKLHFELLPRDKVDRIRLHQKQASIVCMVGDGINDSAALAAADVGIALASGSDLAVSSAPVNLMKNDLLSICNGVRLGRKMYRVMQENLFLAFVYNAVALIVATGILYRPLGIELNPAFAAAAMSFSSISVILNSLRLKKMDLSAA